MRYAVLLFTVLSTTLLSITSGWSQTTRGLEDSLTCRFGTGEARATSRDLHDGIRDNRLGPLELASPSEARAIADFEAHNGSLLLIGLAVPGLRPFGLETLGALPYGWHGFGGFMALLRGDAVRLKERILLRTGLVLDRSHTKTGETLKSPSIYFHSRTLRNDGGGRSNDVRANILLRPIPGTPDLVFLACVYIYLDDEDALWRQRQEWDELRKAEGWGRHPSFD